MRALITGADGFVGHHLAAHLRTTGDVVTSVDRECDVTDFASVSDVLATSRPDVVYHLAALTHVGESFADPRPYYEVNVLGTATLLRAVRVAASEAVVLVVSSADVYGVVREDELPLLEARRPVPISPYARSKLEAEEIAFDAARTMGQRVIVVRPFNHVGPGQSTRFVVPALVSRLLAARDAGADEIAIGDLSARRDFCDVRDVVRAYRLVVQHGRLGEIYHVASGVDVALADVARGLVEMLAPGVRLAQDPSLLRPVEVPVLRGSFAKLHDATGWEPRIALSTSLRDVVAEFESRSP